MKIKNIVAVCMSIVSIIAITGCGTATTDSVNNSANNSISQETIAQSTVQSTTVVVTEAVTEATTQDVGLVPPNYKIPKNWKVIAYSRMLILKVLNGRIRLVLKMISILLLSS